MVCPRAEEMKRSFNPPLREDFIQTHTNILINGEIISRINMDLIRLMYRRIVIPIIAALDSSSKHPANHGFLIFSVGNVYFFDSKRIEIPPTSTTMKVTGIDIVNDTV
jgi:hypothetical protein